MPLSEFDLIEQYFSSPYTGDDGAVVQVPAGMTRVGVAETVTANSPNINTDHPKTVGHRVLSTALNKLAALGGTPTWMTLALTLPNAQASWLEPFSEGLLALAARFDVSLIGGDTTQGPLTITIMLDGLIPIGQGPRIPCPHDLLCISGTLASTANALIAASIPHSFSDQERRHALEDMEFPEPRVTLGTLLRTNQIAAADLTSGLTSGIETLLHGSDLGAVVSLDQLPVSASVKHQMALARNLRGCLSLAGDHELVFSLPAARQAVLLQALVRLDVTATVIGNIDTVSGFRVAEPA